MVELADTLKQQARQLGFAAVGIASAAGSERLRLLWRILVFSAVSAGLGYLLLRQGWTLREPTQVEVMGSAVVSRDQVITAAGLRFPQPLMALQPRQVASDLMGALPVKEVRVSRLMLPPRS